MAKNLNFYMLKRSRTFASSIYSKVANLASLSVLLIGSTLAICVSFSSVASADTLNYPWPTDTQAPCEFGSSGGSSCVNPNNQYDMYDWGVYVNNVFQPYRNGYEYRNCTDYTQWKESTINVSVPTNWGNGGQWYGNAPTNEQSTTPKAWDAAVVIGNPGHVAFVESVNTDGTITVSEYNHDTQGHGDTRTGTASSMGFTGFVDFGVHPQTHSDAIIKVQKTIEPDGTQQLYTATSSDVWQTWWNSNSGTTPLIYISQNNIADTVEFDAGGGVQELFTATNTGVWETNWGNGQNPSSSNIIANLSGVKKILFHSETVSGVTTYQIYLMTNTGVKQYWWNANSNGIQSSTIYSVSNPVGVAFGTSPSGVDEIFTATAGAVEESSFAGGGITNTQIIGISQNNIAAIDKLNSSGGTEILSTATTTGDWDSNWTTGSPTYTQVVNNFNGALAVKRRFDPAGNNQLYLANGGTVEQYWWGSSGSGAASLITISQNNITTIDEDQNGSYEQLYTGAGHIAYETYWGPTNGTGQIINTDTQIANGNVL